MRIRAPETVSYHLHCAKASINGGCDLISRFRFRVAYPYQGDFLVLELVAQLTTSFQFYSAACTNFIQWKTALESDLHQLRKYLSSHAL